MTQTEKTIYITLEEILYLYQALIKRFGGSYGVLDMGLLESALARPRSGYYVTLFEQAAALFHSLINYHAFVGGNKRVAFAATAIFLKLNGQNLIVEAQTAEKFIIKEIIGKRLGVKEIASWLAKACQKI